MLRPFIDANQALGIESAKFMTSAPDDDARELSGSAVEGVIDRTTDRITVASNAIDLRDYSEFASRA